MSKLTIKLRGVVSLALPDEKGGHARAFFPRCMKQRLAHDNENRIISPYFPYVALPKAIVPEGTPSPNLVCEMYLEHFHPLDEPPAYVKAKRLLRWESVSRAERADLHFEELPEKETYYVYYASNSVITLDVISADGLTYHFQPVGPKEPKPKPPHTFSLRWFARLEDLLEEITEPLRATTYHPDASAYLDLTKGQILPVVHIDHTWRFLHSKSGIRRPLADEIAVEINTTELARITIRPYDTSLPTTELHIPPSHLPVILGNEPIEDIAGVGPISSCADPGYDFELHYQLVDTKDALRRPVPLCVNEDEDHLSPPGAGCGPPVVSGGGGD